MDGYGAELSGLAARHHRTPTTHLSSSFGCARFIRISVLRPRSGSSQQRIHRAKPFVLQGHVSAGKLSVPSHHRQRRMAEELLEHEHVTASKDEPLRPGMAQSMGRASDSLDASLHPVVRQNLSHVPAAQPTAADRDEERVIGAKILDHARVAGHGLACRLPQRELALFLALTP